jgi:hypothetical protein
VGRALWQRLSHGLETEGLVEAAMLEFAAVPTVAWLELTGAMVDRQRWEAMVPGIEAARDEVVAEMRRVAGDPLNQKG